MKKLTLAALAAITLVALAPAQGAAKMQGKAHMQHGNMMMGKQAAPIMGPKLLGNNFSFSFINTDGAMRSVRGKFDGEKFDGWMRLDGYDTPISARRTATTPRKA